MFPTSQGNHPGDLCLNGPCNKHHILRPFSILSSQLAKPHGGVKQGRQFPKTSFLQSDWAWTFTRAPAPANKRTSSPYVPTDGVHLTEQCLSTHRPWPKAHWSHWMLFINFNRLWMRSVWSVLVRGIEMHPAGCSSTPSDQPCKCFPKHKPATTPL